jgi:hypothetical protein
MQAGDHVSIDLGQAGVQARRTIESRWRPTCR